MDIWNFLSKSKGSFINDVMSEGGRWGGSGPHDQQC